MPQESNFKVTSSYSTVYVEFLFCWKRYLYPSKQAPSQRESWGQLPLPGALYLLWSNFQFFFEFKKKKKGKIQRCFQIFKTKMFWKIFDL